MSLSNRLQQYRRTLKELAAPLKPRVEEGLRERSSFKGRGLLDYKLGRKGEIHAPGANYCGQMGHGPHS